MARYTTAVDRLVRILNPLTPLAAHLRRARRRSGTFTCAHCAVSRTVTDATRADRRRARALATNHALHGVLADRVGEPYAVAVFGG